MRLKVWTKMIVFIFKMKKKKKDEITAAGSERKVSDSGDNRLMKLFTYLIERRREEEHFAF